MFALLFYSAELFAQKQGNVWVFANKNVVDFNQNEPVVSDSGQIYSSDPYLIEGVTSISDSSGRLLFYSDGIKVWNWQHEVVEAGFKGHRSSTTSAYIVPKPGNPVQYYLFTTDGMQNNLQNGLRYSVIEACRDNGVTVKQKNVMLAQNATEKLVGIKHENGFDYWVISHQYGSNKYLVYLLNQSGIHFQDSVACGTIHIAQSNYYSAAVGQMKASPDGKYICSAMTNIQMLDIVSFSPSTGGLSPIIEINTDTLNGFSFGVYGVSFSANSQRLYLGGAANNKLVQLDAQLLESAPSQLASSAILLSVNNTSPTAFLGLQLGVDGRIYCTPGGKGYLATIDNPDVLGLGCGFQDSTILLPGLCSYSVPLFIDSYSYTSTGICNPDYIPETPTPTAQIYPNPFTGQTTIQLSQVLQNGTLQLHDALGRLVKHEAVQGQQFTLQQSDLSAGLYFLSLYEQEQKLGTWRVAVSE